MFLDQPAFIAVEGTLCQEQLARNAHHADVVNERRHQSELKLRLPFGVIVNQARQHLGDVQSMRGVGKQGREPALGLGVAIQPLRREPFLG